MALANPHTIADLVEALARLDDAAGKLAKQRQG